jgi:CO/xanthine dehydrogenase Mo-binding subunit
MAKDDTKAAPKYTYTEHKLIGKDFTVPDIEAKVTGRAKYVEDFRADNMVFCKSLTARSRTPRSAASTRRRR